MSDVEHKRKRKEAADAIKQVVSFLRLWKREADKHETLASINMNYKRNHALFYDGLCFARSEVSRKRSLVTGDDNSFTCLQGRTLTYFLLCIEKTNNLYPFSVKLACGSYDREAEFTKRKTFVNRFLSLWDEYSVFLKNKGGRRACSFDELCECALLWHRTREAPIFDFAEATENAKRLMKQKKSK